MNEIIYFSDGIFRQLYDELEIEAKDLNLNVTEENIPDYLLSTSSSFTTTFFSELKRSYKPINFDDLQGLSILTQKLFLINFQEKLWQIYLECATGQIIERKQFQLYTNKKPISIWSRQVISLIIAQQYNHVTNVNDITQNIYMDFIKQKQLDLDNQTKQYQIQIDTTKQRIEHEVEALMYKIDKFIQKTDAMTAIKLYFEAYFALMEYTYIDELLQYEYYQQKPNEEHVCH